MHSKLYSIKFFLLFLLLSTGAVNVVSGQLQLVKSMSNYTTGGDGSTASKDDILEYSMTATNLSAASIINATLFDNIPAGTSYVTGSTTVNGVSVADVNGKMPFVTAGGLINSPSYGPGILTPGATATIVYHVRVTANAGTVSTAATLRATDSTGIVGAQSNSLVTNVIADPLCSTIFQVTGILPTSSSYNVIRNANTSNGKAEFNFYTGPSGPCYNAITGAALSNGSLLQNCGALAYDHTNNWIYFVNGTTTGTAYLSYVDFNYASPRAEVYVGYPLETNTATGYNINRMTMASDGYGYALTANGLDLTRFSISPSTNLPVISRLGALVNDTSNGANNILSEVGGDIFGDGSGKLYFATNKLYRIDPASRIATYLGTISNVPTSNNSSVAAYSDGYVYMSGGYANVYRVDLATMSGSSITGGSTSSVYYNSDYADCSMPVLTPALKVNKSYRNTQGSTHIKAGDTIEYTIEVTDMGNLSAAAVKLYDTIPAHSYYYNGSTTINGVPVADVAGSMPFSVAGGQYINSPGETAGLVKVGDSNKAVIKFWIVTDPLQTICNQAVVIYPGATGDTVLVYSDDPAQPGTVDPTCFYSDTASGLRRSTTQTSQLIPASGALPVSVQVGPNPFHSQLNLRVQLNTSEAVNVQLFDLYGRCVYTTTKNLEAGANSLQVNVPAGLSQGIYVLNVSAGNQRLLQHKLLKQ